MRCADPEFRGRNLLEGGVCSDISNIPLPQQSSFHNNNIPEKRSQAYAKHYMQEIPQADRSLTKIADFGP